MTRARRFHPPVQPLRLPGPARRARPLCRCACLAALVLGALLVGACRMLPTGRALLRPEPPAYTEEDLREALADFSAHAAALVRAAADTIYEETSRRDIRVRSLRWKMQMIPSVQRAAFQDDPRESYVEVLTLMVIVRQYLTEGDGRELFAEHQERVIETARRLEAEALAIGEDFLAPPDLERMRTEVEAFARGRPIQGTGFVVEENLQRVLAERERGAVLDWVIRIPMTPFRAFEGVSSGAVAIREFNETAAELTQIVESLPEQVRWQVQLLLFDIEDRDTMQQSLGSLEALATSARTAAAVAERLPDDLAALLADSRDALVEADRAIAGARELMGPLGQVAEQLQQASASWEAILARDREPDPEARPFDIREWEATAREVGAAAAELRGLAQELRALNEAPGLGGPFAELVSTVDRTQAGAESVVDRAAWRGFQLLAVFFVLLLAYRWIAARVAPRT